MRENFVEGVWLGRGEGKEMVGPRCFQLGLTKKFSPQNEEKTEGRKYPYALG